MPETAQFVWARPEMNVTFRAEIMPGTAREERTFRIEKVLPNGRVTLYGFKGEYRETAFETLNFLREKARNNQNS
ncbi:MAG: hypothetical protein JO053_10495 [Acidobacteria bacterium]|nr:hypothetical protein [Acidobacteriota bacterium]